MKREKMDKRSGALLDELETLLDSPRAEEIVANDWLHDGSLAVPSLDIIRYLGWRMLTGHGIKLEATKKDRYDLISLLVGHLRGESLKVRQKSITGILRRLECFRFLNTGKAGQSDPYVHEWLPILWPFLYPDTPANEKDAVALAAGERLIARGIIETMILRAIFTQDYKRVSSLALALENISIGQSPKPTVENRIKGGILRCLPYLNETLGRLPSRAEIQFFMRQLDAFNGLDGFPARQNPWVDAFREFRYPAELRKIRIDEDLLTSLARKVRNFTG
jgi:hypothetical protein